MIKIGLLIIILSFYSDGLMSIYQNITYFNIFSFYPLFTITALVLSYPYFREQRKTYFKYVLIIGLLYDLAYTNTLFLNLVLFMGLGFLIKYFYNYFNSNFINGLLLNLFIIIIYELAMFLILNLVKYVVIDLKTFSLMLISFIITNTLYYIISYFVLFLMHLVVPVKVRFK